MTAHLQRPQRQQPRRADRLPQIYQLLKRDVRGVVYLSSAGLAAIEQDRCATEGFGHLTLAEMVEEPRRQLDITPAAVIARLS